MYLLWQKKRHPQAVAMRSQVFLDWSLSGVEREWPLEPRIDVNDPKQSCCCDATNAARESH